MSADTDVVTHPPVSVVMTALNEHRHLADAVYSVLEQDYPGEIELVVAVGPSHDGTLALAEELARTTDRMRVVSTRPAAPRPG